MCCKVDEIRPQNDHHYHINHIDFRCHIKAFFKINGYKFKVTGGNRFWDKQPEGCRCFVVFAFMLISPFAIYSEENCQESTQSLCFPEDSANLGRKEGCLLPTEPTCRTASKENSGNCCRIYVARSCEVQQSPADCTHHDSFSAFRLTLAPVCDHLVSDYKEMASAPLTSVHDLRSSRT